MAQVSIGRRLPRDFALGLFLAFSCLLVFHAVQMTDRWGLGWDAHAYYVAWSGDLYDVAPGTVDAYNYSPLFAQLTWPLTHLPWPVFCALFIGAAALSIAWLVRPLPLPLAIGMWLFCTPEIFSGNVFWLLALATVAGFTRGSPWCVAAFTKVVPCLGPVWFALRGEWRRLGGFVVTFVALFAVSYAIGPSLWHEWWDFLVSNAGGSPEHGRHPARWSSDCRWPPCCWCSPPAPTAAGSCRSACCSPAPSSGGARSPCWPRSRGCAATDPPRRGALADRRHTRRLGTGDPYAGPVITAIVFVKADVARIPEVAEAIAALEGISEVYSVTGQIDLIALVRVRRHEDVAAVVADRLNKVPGVTSTETHIAFRAYSRHDLESAFALGLD